MYYIKLLIIIIYDILYWRQGSKFCQYLFFSNPITKWSFHFSLHCCIFPTCPLFLVTLFYNFRVIININAVHIILVIVFVIIIVFVVVYCWFILLTIVTITNSNTKSNLWKWLLLRKRSAHILLAFYCLLYYFCMCCFMNITIMTEC